MQKPYDVKRGEPALKALVSLPVALGVLGMVVFFGSVGNVDKMAAPASFDEADHTDIMKKCTELKPYRLMISGRRTDAVNEAQRLADLKPRDLSVQVCAATVYLKVGGQSLTQEGLSRLKQAVAMAPRNKQIRIMYARALAQAGQTDRAMEQYEQIAAASPHWYEPRIERAQLILLYGRPSEAAKTFHQIADDHPSKPEARLQAGVALARAGKPDDGLDEYMKGVEAEKSIDQPQALKQIFLVWGTLEKAKFDLERRVADKPHDPVLLQRLAEVYLYLDDLEDAKDCLVRCKKLTPANWEVKRCLAIVYYRLGMRKQAAQEFSQSVSLERKQLEEQERKKKVFG